MTAKVVAFTIQKGGVAKTSSVAITGYLLSNVFEKRVLMIDMDTQGNLSEVFLRERTKKLVNEGRIPGTVLEGLVDDEDVLPYVVNIRPDLDLVAASDDLSGLPAYLHDPSMGFPAKNAKDPVRYHRSNLLNVSLEKAREHYDYILIDTQPSLSELVTNAWVASDTLVIPFDCSRYAISALEDFFENFYAIRQSVNPNIQVFGILPTLVDNVGADFKGVLEMFREHPEFGQYLLPYSIPRKATIRRVSHLGLEDNHELMDACGPYIPLVKGLMEIG